MRNWKIEIVSALARDLSPAHAAHGGDIGALLVAACRARSYDADDVRDAIGRPKGAAGPSAEADDQTPGGSLSLKP